jgi:hypothetical protein
MKFDADRRVVGGRLVILVKSSAYFSRLYPNYRIISGCVPCRTLKEVHPNCAFFESLVVPLQAVVDHVRQKLLAPLAWLENRTVQDRIEFAKDGCFFKFIEGVGIASNLFAPNRINLRTHGTNTLPFESSCDRNKP